MLQAALGLPSGSGLPSLRWPGTFHGIGARLLREHAAQIGLSPSFTIHDRADAEDMIGLVRHESWFSTSIKRFPLEGTCLAICSRVINTQANVREVLGDSLPWYAAFEPDLRRLFAKYVAEKRKQQVLDHDDLLLYWQTERGNVRRVPRVPPGFGQLSCHLGGPEQLDLVSVALENVQRRVLVSLGGEDAEIGCRVVAARLDETQVAPSSRLCEGILPLNG